MGELSVTFCVLKYMMPGDDTRLIVASLPDRIYSDYCYFKLYILKFICFKWNKIKNYLEKELESHRHRIKNVFGLDFRTKSPYLVESVFNLKIKGSSPQKTLHAKIWVHYLHLREMSWYSYKILKIICSNKRRWEDVFRYLLWKHFRPSQHNRYSFLKCLSRYLF